MGLWGVGLKSEGKGQVFRHLVFFKERVLGIWRLEEKLRGSDLSTSNKI